MEISYRAGAPMLGDAERGRVEPLGDIARFVHTKKKEGNTASSIALQGGQSL